ncbi:MAG: hotdog fold thioesterase [Halobacteriovoraceae bacterium]|jgi:1,4-dihydroxy-2-naphthoyl-CoA hydrolase|nr:hotdog fold thioesterase [Halobacteriovoraceae bacterium]MBT5093258.1 hotdog fold thioesterase [Halobacteriovoraceae bacterium]
MDHQNSIWFRKDYTHEEGLKLLNDSGKNTITAHVGIEVTEIGDNYLIGTMPVDERTVQPGRRLHGGSSCVFAETLGSIAANMILDSSKYVAFGQVIDANHLRPALEGTKVIGKTTPIHLGRTTQVWRIEITTEEGKLVCDSKLTMAVVKK